MRSSIPQVSYETTVANGAAPKVVGAGRFGGRKVEKEFFFRVTDETITLEYDGRVYAVDLRCFVEAWLGAICADRLHGIMP